MPLKKQPPTARLVSQRQKIREVNETYSNLETLDRAEEMMVTMGISHQDIVSLLTFHVA